MRYGLFFPVDMHHCMDMGKNSLCDSEYQVCVLQFVHTFKVLITASKHIHTCVCMSLHKYVCMFVCMYSMYVCMYGN